MIVWTAGHNMPGYLPESEPVTFETRKEALDYTVDELRRVADDYDTHGAPLNGVTGEEYEQAADWLRAHDADVDGDWYDTFEDGRIAYWFQSVDLPEFACPMGDWQGDDGYCPRHRCRTGNPELPYKEEED